MKITMQVAIVFTNLFYKLILIMSLMIAMYYGVLNLNFKFILLPLTGFVLLLICQNLVYRYKSLYLTDNNTHQDEHTHTWSATGSPNTHFRCRDCGEIKDVI